MCGRFNVIDDPLTQFIIEITGISVDLSTQLNVAPTEQIPVLLDDGEGWALRDMRWWLIPYWSREPTNKYAMFNAKSETLTKSSAFREPFRHRRCIVPVSGYYEWRKEGSVKVPYYIEAENEGGLAFAALWDRWRPRDGNPPIESCTIVTAAAPESMESIHNRIPVHLTGEQVSNWVNGDSDPQTLSELLVPEIRTPLRVTPMSTYVNNARNKDERCLEPLGDSVIVH